MVERSAKTQQGLGTEARQTASAARCFAKRQNPAGTSDGTGAASTEKLWKSHWETALRGVIHRETGNERAIPTGVALVFLGCIKLDSFGAPGLKGFPGPFQQLFGLLLAQVLRPFRPFAQQS